MKPALTLKLALTESAGLPAGRVRLTLPPSVQLALLLVLPLVVCEIVLVPPLELLIVSEWPLLEESSVYTALPRLFP